VLLEEIISEAKSELSSAASGSRLLVSYCMVDKSETEKTGNSEEIENDKTHNKPIEADRE
jgi:hypothetical protein